MRRGQPEMAVKSSVVCVTSASCLTDFNVVATVLCCAKTSVVESHWPLREVAINPDPPARIDQFWTRLSGRGSEFGFRRWQILPIRPFRVSLWFLRLMHIYFTSFEYNTAAFWCTCVAFGNAAFAVFTSANRSENSLQGSHASWKVLDFSSWKFKDLESPGKSLWSCKVLEIKA